ncbi:DUF924 family protein [Asticcacaulis sp. YBE204]|uniref:DUF924 family protein n=1 Tax=Asticcacaulis sp. YBE204 TaxID=1282363 RepID=UPI0003C3BBE3|nr:DUF924 family protein [Asticcacaulis sp. YBE204]ESQ78455.1 hypothetical protein AEYBE204_12945 [Asticcacaulis sp. YBE204]
MIDDVIAFWEAAGPQKWFAKDEAFDRDFRERFLDLHMQAAARQLDDWADTARGSLALLILLDQFPRNAFRGTAHMFATDPLALFFARQAVDAGQDTAIADILRPFLYLPFEHSENLTDQERAVELMRPLGGQSLDYAEGHRDIIQRFGRFPHRNPVLGRVTTAPEQAFIDGGGFAG